jgi:hypothetical protein
MCLHVDRRQTHNKLQLQNLFAVNNKDSKIAFLLLFFISKSQCVYFIHFQQFLWGKPVLFKGMSFLGFGPIPIAEFVCRQ